jgi:TPR repeat protein
MTISDELREAFDAYDCGDVSKAIAKMEACAESGEPKACFTLALWYNHGEGVRRNEALCQYWLAMLEQLAEDGNLEAQWDLGQYHRFGDVIEYDLDQANAWLRRAADGGHPEAQHHLGWFDETGQYGFPTDLRLAEHWYQRALASENPETMYMFAMRQIAPGELRDDAECLLRRAAQRGFVPAIEFLKARRN